MLSFRKININKLNVSSFCFVFAPLSYIKPENGQSWLKSELS